MKMSILLGAAGVAAAVLLTGAVATMAEPAAPSDTARFDAQGRLIPPTDYRDWVFLSSGVDMSYSEGPAPVAADAHTFDNVFAPRAAYAAFKREGRWPNGTVLILENRGGASRGSINKRGAFQSGAPTGLEAHVKDEARFKGGWGFFGGLTSGKPATMIPYAATCYACHQQHAAADTTFVQFYPTLLPVATERGTLSAAYLAETRQDTAAPAAHP
jgi:hypothetical protein